ncbi:MAG: BamA/TamA family outer membrane protein [Gemmatimonadetes bacterium]|nr:BamA/TamA family outer membrane protein [Gemmatimonadota bacterium]
MIRQLNRQLRLLLAACAFLAVPVAGVRGQGAICGNGDVELVGLKFAGNRAFSNATLASGIATTPSSWARRTFRIGGRRNCLDRLQFALDAVRLRLFYRNHGYVGAEVDTVVAPAGADRVRVQFTIVEGEPMVVSDLIIAGLDTIEERGEFLRDLPVTLGGPFDRYAIEEARDTLIRRMRNRGYPDAEVFVGFDTRTEANTATVRLGVQPGTQVRLGPVRVVVTPREGSNRGIGDGPVRRVAGIRDGELYSEQRLERAKRALYQTEAYDQVAVRTDSVTVRGDTARMGVTVDLVEGYMRVARGAVGYGTLDCFRATSDFTQYNFLGGAARLDVHARVSKIGISEPITGAASLCPQAKADPYSRDLNYYVGASASRSAVFRDFAPSVSLYSERRSEYKSFLRTTPIGSRVALARTLGRTSQAFGYSVEFGKTEAQPALLCAVFNACEEADRTSFRREQRLAVASFAYARETSDNPVDPTRGTSLRVELRTAGAYTGSDPSLRFHKMLLDGAVYRPLSENIVLAARLRVGAVVGLNFSFGNAAVYVPPHERLFAGGPTTVRGFSQNELGPAVYIAAAFDTVRASGAPGGDPSVATDTVFFRARADVHGERTVPAGGNALVVANFEARFRSPLLPELIQWTAFADVGEVWNRGSPGAALGLSALRWTPGAGVRIRTLIGVIRVDIAYNPYERPAGAAYFDTPIAVGGALLCVSPGNSLRITTDSNGQTSQAAGRCQVSFVPPRGSAFFRRLTPSISIGQAF